MTMFEAIINVPGYMPMSDEPHVFPTASEAWGWLRDERERDFDTLDYDEPEWDEDPCLEEIESMMDQGVPGVVYGRTPGSDSDHDLGLAYSVVQVSKMREYADAMQRGQWHLVAAPVKHADYPHEPGRLYDCPLCESQCFCTGEGTDALCVFCGEKDLSNS